MGWEVLMGDTLAVVFKTDEQRSGNQESNLIPHNSCSHSSPVQ
jgi:hypothetical protein